MLPNIGWFDIGLSVLYLVVIYFFAFRYQQKKVETNLVYRYYLLGLSAKIIGAISFVLISIYYYNGGDTFVYFKIAERVRTHLQVDFSETINLLFTSYEDLGSLDYNPFGKGDIYERNSTWVFVRIIFVFNVLGFGSYLVSSILIGVFSFFGVWLGYFSISRLYSKSSKLLLVPFFLIPTATIWSSGLLRDTIVIGAFGVLLYSCSNLFIYKTHLFWNTIITVLGGALLLFLKPIFFVILFPCLMIWALLYFVIHVASSTNKTMVIVAVLSITVGFGYVLNETVLINNSNYQFGNLMHTLKGFQTIHPDYPNAKSIYAVSEMEYTPLGLFFKIPEALQVTFFRPYLWEVSSFSMLVAGIESLLLLIFSLIVLFAFRLMAFKIIIQNKEIVFLLLLALSYAVLTGLSASNFGALSRFKIPAVLSLSVALILIYDNKKAD